MDDQKVTGGADWLYKSCPDDLNEVDKTLKSYKITCISGEGKKLPYISHCTTLSLSSLTPTLKPYVFL